MTRDMIFGIIVLVMTVTISGYLVFWARHFINKISKLGADTARKITKEMNG